jgi:hypothetical protein
MEEILCHVLVINTLTGKNQFHERHLGVNLQKVELLKSSGLGEDPLNNYESLNLGSPPVDFISSVNCPPSRK